MLTTETIRQPRIAASTTSVRATACHQAFHNCSCMKVFTSIVAVSAATVELVEVVPA